MDKEQHLGQAQGGNKSNEGNDCKSRDYNIYIRYTYTYIYEAYSPIAFI